MDGMYRLRSRLLGGLAALAGLVLVLAGCSLFRSEPAAGAADPPAGFTPYDGAGYRIAYPAGWSVNQQTDRHGQPLVYFNGPNGPSGLPPELGVGRSPLSGSFDDAMTAFRGSARLVKSEQFRSDRPATVEAATAAHLTEGVYPERTPAGTEVQVRIIDLHVLSPDGTLFDVYVRAPEAEFDEATLRAALESFRLA
jgi:hypothetical protein